jgi:predicted RecB family nuclease
MQEVIDPADGGPIFVYHATYERSRLVELAQRHPEYADLLQGYVARLVDLLPVVKSHFYHPDMRGSFSIKKVLPVVAPELDYGALEEIQEGTGAQVAYIEAALDSTTPAGRKAEIEQRLRIYCRQDTWAMVRVAYFLAGQATPAAR